LGAIENLWKGSPPAAAPPAPSPASPAVDAQAPYVPVEPRAAQAAAELGQPFAEPAPPERADPAAARKAANDLFKAMDGWGTDEKAIFAALKGKSPAEVAAIRAAYKDRTNGRDLDADMKGELGGDNATRAEALLAGDRHTAALEALKDARGILSTTDPAAVKEALAGVKDPAERKRLLEEAG